MKELLKKLLDSGRKDALDSLEKLTEAAEELGYTNEQIEDALDGFNGFPLDDEELDMVAGGMGGDMQQTGIYQNADTAQVFSQYNVDTLMNMSQQFGNFGSFVNPNQGYGVNQGGNSNQGIARL